jgi:hypothetical protein
LKVTNRYKTGGNARNDEEKIMSKNTPNERIYLSPSKPVNEMTKEEIRTFAEETYEQIIRSLTGQKNTETK